MATDQDERPRFFEDQYLGADDLNLAVDYSRVQNARHALGGHTWGIALGLELWEQTRANGEIDVYISPGYAWDGFGRPIIVLEPVLVPVGLFQGITFQQAVDGGTGGKPEGRLLAVWLRYQEQAGQGPLPGFEACTDEGKSRRIRETFAVEVSAFQPPSPASLEGGQDNIVVNGTSIAPKDALTIPRTSNPYTIAEIPDRSIPFQEFPSADEPKRWLVPVGLLRWKPPTAGQAGKFIMRNQADIAENRRSRRYIGLVAESIQAADGHLRIKPRNAQNSSLWTDDLLWVEGKLRIEGDARLLGGALHFRDPADIATNFPAAIQRVDTPSGKALQVGIAQAAQDSKPNRVAIGAITNNSVDEKLVVLDNGNVGIGSTSPQSKVCIQSNNSPGHINVILDNATDKRHMTLTVGSVGTGLHFCKDNRFFISADAYSERNTGGFGNELFTLLASGDTGLGTSSPRAILDARTTRLSNHYANAPQQGQAVVGVFRGGAQEPADARARARFIIEGETDQTSPSVDLRINDSSGNTRGTHLYYVPIQYWPGAPEHFGIWTHGLGTALAIHSTSNNVGIGTISPTEKLDVRGNIKLGAAGDLFALGALENLRVVVGHVNSGGGIASGTGFNSNNQGPGTYQVQFTTPFLTNPIVIVSPVNSQNATILLTAVAITNNGFNVLAKNIVPPQEGSLRNTEFSFVVMGRRV